MASMKLFTPREAAQVLGVSYPTLKQWIYKKKIRTMKTAGGHHRVPEKEIDRFLYRATERGDVPERRNNFRRISGRNQLVGRVTDVKISGIMAQVSLSIGGQHITSIITADAVRERFGARVSVVLDGGRCDGRPSTVVSLTDEGLQSLREGVVDFAELEALATAGS